MGNPMQTATVCRRVRTSTTDSDSESRPRRRLRENRTHRNADRQENGTEGHDISDTEDEDDNAEYELIADTPRPTERTSGHFVDIETPDGSNSPPNPELDFQRVRRRHFGFREISPLTGAADRNSNPSRRSHTYSLTSNVNRSPPSNEAEGDLAMLVAHLRQQVLLNRITNAEPAPGTSPPNYIAGSSGSRPSQAAESVTRPAPVLTWRPPTVNSNTHPDMTTLSRLRNHFSQSPSPARGLPSPTETPQGGSQSVSQAGVLPNYAAGSLAFPSMIPRAQNPRPVSRSLRLHVGESGYATVSLTDDHTPYSAQRRENGPAL